MKLEFSERPEGRPVFSMLRTVKEHEIDQQDHVSNIEYVRWIQEAATSHSDAVGLTLDAFYELGAWFLIRRHQIEYLGEALLGDRIRVDTWADEMTGALGHRRTRIFRLGEDGEETVITEAMTLWIYISIENPRPKRLPKEVIEAYLNPPKYPSITVE